MRFQPLPDDFEPTRASLQSYARAAIALSRTHGIERPNYWHVSLKLRPGGLASDPIPLPDGGTVDVRVDLVRHEVVIDTSAGEAASLAMTDGMTGTEMGDAVIAAAVDLGLEGEYNREKFESDEPLSYDPDHAMAVARAVADTYFVMQRHRSSLTGQVGPIQLWPHHFDLSMEWFGTRSESYDGKELPAQLNLGFSPSDRPYFYSNPWPFDESLVDSPLPSGAEWHTDGWQGTILHYDQLAGDPDAAVKLQAYAQAVFDVAAPTLTA